MHPGFFIEHKKRLSKRVGMELAEVERGIKASELVEEPSQDAELLQYLLANTDFSLIRGPQGDSCCHNVVLFHAENAGEPPYAPVPYDFDITGFVDPPGAVPAEGLRLRRVTQRLYRGFCRDDAVFNASLDKFLQAQGDIEALINDWEPLSKRAKKKTLKFVGRFYDIVTDPKSLAKEVTEDCRG